MRRYTSDFKSKVRRLRSTGKTYGEINLEIGEKLAKSTLSELCKGVKLPDDYISRIEKLNFTNITKARTIAHEISKIKREEFFRKIRLISIPTAALTEQVAVAKVALAMLCLGEASKYSSKRRLFSLGSSDPRIIVTFLRMLEQCFDFDIEKVRCTVQCRADQNTVDLELFWRKVTGVPKRLFYKPLIDPRTIGKPTLKPLYKGVLRVDYFDTKVHLELELLADLIYNLALDRKGLGRWRNG